jgi:outer membrane protein assembly factor BamA
VINIEYRYPVWEYMDGQLFFDAGRVFDSIKDVSFKDFKYSGGIGLRFVAGEYFLSRLQLAYGNEGFRVLFKTSQAF